jgi:hypothetical protein
MTEQHTKRSWEQTLYRWLSAPLLITIIGALLINYVIPKITSKSQSHQRALEIKTQLVTDMSESASSAVVTGELIATDVVRKRNGGDPNAVFQSGLRDWQIASARIRSEIEGYFPKTALGDHWNDFSQALTSMYALSASGTTMTDRCARVRQVQRYLGILPGCDPYVRTGPVHWGLCLRLVRQRLVLLSFAPAISLSHDA